MAAEDALFTGIDIGSTAEIVDCEACIFLTSAEVFLEMLAELVRGGQALADARSMSPQIDGEGDQSAPGEEPACPNRLLPVRSQCMQQ